MRPWHCVNATEMHHGCIAWCQHWQTVCCLSTYISFSMKCSLRRMPGWVLKTLVSDVYHHLVSASASNSQPDCELIHFFSTDDRLVESQTTYFHAHAVKNISKCSHSYYLEKPLFLPFLKCDWYFLVHSACDRWWMLYSHLLCQISGLCNTWVRFLLVLFDSIHKHSLCQGALGCVNPWKGLDFISIMDAGNPWKVHVLG